ncbi:DJ-1 family glyoxalase III [Halofilum ochraceum]|uniref:DJ-1 family glyoxalase III n=1 Tax=Halofilum ochraceum TaxID=1611323 RepID=UPI0008DB0D88|nr:DJ-1 family glyoxalase III [Halofilum ochraceum]
MARILIPIASGCEELEAVTLIDLFRRAEFEVVTAGLEEGPVTCSRGVVLVPDTTLAMVAAESFDAIVLPGGGPGADRLREDERLIDMLNRHREGDGWLGAICAAPGVLAAHNLLGPGPVTAFPGALEPYGIESSDAPIEIDGHVATSRGPGTAMDFALELIERLDSRERRREVEARLQR